MQIPGVVDSSAVVRRDARGVFQKIHYQGTSSSDWSSLEEVFLTQSTRGVIRGMHLQWGTHSAKKFVKCIEGEILDVLVDLRSESLTFLKSTVYELSGSDSRVISMPYGVAHGYQVLSEKATVIYGTDQAWCEQCDTGFQPLTFDFEWPIKEVILSDKDLSLPMFSLIPSTLSQRGGVQH
jgi:dTDP-4-dehydrorhamnose 3,5-epimerase